MTDETRRIDRADADEQGRFRQRRRTRQGIVNAAIALLQAGHDPSIAEIAEAADVSRRTVYMYFPTLEQLLIDATVGMLGEVAMEEAIDAADNGDDVLARVSAMVREMIAQSAETLPLGRRLVRLTVESPDEPTTAPRRGYRRVSWIERALRPIRDQLAPARYDRLVSALTVVIGWEAMIVLADLRGQPSDAQRETMLWSARALITAALTEEKERGTYV